jgi:hypothetical protein
MARLSSGENLNYYWLSVGFIFTLLHTELNEMKNKAKIWINGYDETVLCHYSAVVTGSYSLFSNYQRLYTPRS